MENPPAQESQQAEASQGPAAGGADDHVSYELKRDAFNREYNSFLVRNALQPSFWKEISSDTTSWE
jgi:hypothetical protein